MNKKVYVYIGRFQIAHEGHEQTIKYAMEKSDHLVLVIGSANLARDPKNPFTAEERKNVLEEICCRLAKEEWGKGREIKYTIVTVPDYIYNNNKWLMKVQEQVYSAINSNDITLTGCNKDDSTVYLKYFAWKTDFVPEHKVRNITTNATEYRHNYFIKREIPDSLPIETRTFLTKFMIHSPDIYSNLVQETKFIEGYRQKMFNDLPYTNIPFLTGDSIVVASGHILLVKRRSYPGKGLYALPGGFFDAFQDQDQIETALRELQEETKIDAPLKVLKGNIKDVMEFGDMNRSLRWRIITKCIYIQLPDLKLPKVKGSDDAEEAFWMPLGQLEFNQDKFFEDHYGIITTMLKL